MAVDRAAETVESLSFDEGCFFRLTKVPNGT